MSEKTETGRKRISDCLKLYDNDDALLRRYVLQNFEADKAAYWTSVSYHSQKAATLAYKANCASHDNDGGYLDLAANDAYGAGKHHFHEVFDTLIPLNERAARDLSEAYARHRAGRHEDELLLRRFAKVPA